MFFVYCLKNKHVFGPLSYNTHVKQPTIWICPRTIAYYLPLDLQRSFVYCLGMAQIIWHPTWVAMTVCGDDLYSVVQTPALWNVGVVATVCLYQEPMRRYWWNHSHHEPTAKANENVWHPVTIFILKWMYFFYIPNSIVPVWLPIPLPHSLQARQSATSSPGHRTLWNVAEYRLWSHHFV